jgi:hypothetical protein
MTDKKPTGKWLIVDGYGNVCARLKKCTHPEAQEWARLLFPQLSNLRVFSAHVPAFDHATVARRERVAQMRRAAASLPWLTPERCVALGIPSEQMHATKNECASTGGAQ